MKFYSKIEKFRKTKSLWTSSNLNMKKLKNNYYFNQKYTFSPKNNNINLKGKICFSNNKENQDKYININPFSNYIEFSKSQYYHNRNNSNKFSLYNANNMNNQINTSPNSVNNSNIYSNDSKDKKYIGNIKLSTNNLFEPFYNKNNTIKNKNSSIIKYSNNIVLSKKNLNDKNKYKYFSSNNFSMPKRLNNSQNKNKKNQGYISYYNNKSPNNKNFKKKKISKRIFDKEFKTILNSNGQNMRNEDNLTYKNNTFIDQQILDYLNKNNNEKKNLIKRMRNQKMTLNKNISSEKLLNNKEKKIIDLKNLNSYSYINNNYNCCCSNQNSTLNLLNNSNDDKIGLSYEIILSKKNLNQNMNINNQKNSNISMIYPNDTKNKFKKYPLRISNYNNENINLNNIIENKSLINNQQQLQKNKPNRKDIKILDKNNSYNNNFCNFNVKHICSPRNLKFSHFGAQNLSPSQKKLLKENMNTTDINIKYENIKNNFKFEIGNLTINDNLSVKKNSINMNKKDIISKQKNNKNNSNIIKKSQNISFCNNSNSKNKIEKVIPIDKRINITTKLKKTENNKITNLKKKEERNLRGQNSYKIIHKKNNSLKSNKKLNKIENIKVSNCNINKEIFEDRFRRNVLKNNEKIKENESLNRVSIQSINDSKIMDLASKYIKSEENLDKKAIAEILNAKKENNRQLL